MIKTLLVSLMVLTGFVTFDAEVNQTNFDSNEIFVSGITEEYSNTLVEASNDVIAFSDIQGGAQTYSWVICGNPIIADAEDNYEYKSSEMVTQAYRTSAGSVIYPINEEKYGLYAVDSVGDELRLEPLYTLNQAHNLTGDGRVHLRISTVSQFTSSDIARCNDSRKMKDLYSDLALSGDSTKVGYGKVMYRTGVVGGYYSSWSYVDLNSMIDNNVSLTFAEGLAVQIVVIYEIKEYATSIWVPHKYYHVRGIYQFMTSE